MTITLESDLESALNDLARKRGVEPAVLAIDALRERFLSQDRTVEPLDDWERRLMGAATDCGVALSHKSLSGEGLYE
jgi:hypothetical protein